MGEDEARLRPDVTGYLGTPSYRSPEQAAGERLTPATDVWSWGLAVLEMFIGEVTWGSGVAAPEALKAYLKRPADPELPAMPNGVAEVLQKCFRRDPAERWASLAEAADALQRAYRQAMGKDYPRPTPAVPDPSRQTVVTHDRRTTTGVQWDDPSEWLIKAFEADGRHPAQVEAFLPSRAGSRKAQAITDLAAYEEARCIFERLVAGDGKTWKLNSPIFTARWHSFTKTLTTFREQWSCSARQSPSANAWWSRRGGGSWRMPWPKHW